MRVAITGDRDWTNRVVIRNALSRLDPAKDSVVLGDARGADAIAHSVCVELELPFARHDADWSQYGRAAGPIRNKEMLDDNVDAVWFFHDDINNSRGTRNCVQQALRRGLDVLDGRVVGEEPGAELYWDDGRAYMTESGRIMTDDDWNALTDEAWHDYKDQQEEE